MADDVQRQLANEDECRNKATVAEKAVTTINELYIWLV